MASKRNIYLKMKSMDEAREALFQGFSHIEPMGSETVASPDAVGRVLAEPVFAELSSPNFHAAAMDGIAVDAEETFGAGETSPKVLLRDENAFFVNTGHVLPEGTNAVIMIENVNALDDDRLEIIGPAFPWQHVRKMGEDIVATELLFPRNHTVTPYCLGALLSGGVFEVKVRKKPRVLVIPTGSEIRDWRGMDLADFKPGEVLETNSYVLGKLVEASGGEFVKGEVVVDDISKIQKAVDDALDDDYQIVMTVGGSSAGSEDYAKTAVSELGEVLVHGVTMMPGKPVLMGKVKQKPVFGMPGYPVSAIIAFEQFVRPLICKMLGTTEPQRQKIQVQATRKIASKLGVEEFLRVKLGKVGERIVATPLPRGAGIITSITEADGIVRVPNHSEGIKDDEPAEAELLKPISSIENTIVVVGSHDNTLDILADQLKVHHANITLSSSHVGSMGGLMAIRRGVCHLAGSHLLDVEDGSYNISYIKRYLPDTPVKVVNLVMRDQGLIVLPKNPKNIRGVEDLAREDVTFINRQGGSGTRVLLDFRLNQLGIDPAGIKGYGDDEFTHMSVAAAVLSGRADVGLGIYAAAKALKLDFVPVVTEEYDLVIPEIYFETENIRILLETIETPEFKRRVEALGGYSMEKTGTIMM